MTAPSSHDPLGLEEAPSSIRTMARLTNRQVDAIRGVLHRGRYRDRVLKVMKGSVQEPDHGLVDLFHRGRSLERAAASRALAPLALETWAAAGLIRLEDTCVRPAIRLTPYRDLLVTSDHDWDVNASANPNAVMGLTGSSLWLARFTIRRPVRRTLDLGTGTGIQAMLASRHSERVVAVDLNPRALRLAEFNAQLNGIENIEFVKGDLFEAAGKRRFNLVVCNPPFSISPASACLYRDNAMEGDDFARRLVQTLPGLLRKGGYAQIICNWIERADEDWFSGPAGWLRGLGSDAWIVRGRSTAPSDYARTWLQNYETGDSSERHRQWLEYYAHLGVGSIGSGVVTLRRRKAGRNWLRVDGSQPAIVGEAGVHLHQGFQLRDYLDSRSDKALAGDCLRVAPDVRLTREAISDREGWRPQPASVRLMRGLTFSTHVDPRVQQILVRCNGQVPLGALLKEVAVGAGGDCSLIEAALLDSVRKLIALGFLHPVGTPAETTTAKSRS